MKNIIAIALLGLLAFSSPVMAADEDGAPGVPPKASCTSFKDVTEKFFSVDPTWYDLTKDQDAAIRALFEAHNMPIPDEIITIKMGTTEKAKGVAFLYGFDKDGCLLGSTTMPIADFHKALNSGS